MLKSGPIIVIEDDPDDQFMLSQIFKKLAYRNEVIFIGDGETALSYLRMREVQPFMIISDINMPKMNGVDVRKAIVTDRVLLEKCIPYIFFSTNSNQEMVRDAYSLRVHGYFRKPSSMSDLESTIKTIVDYWMFSEAPYYYR